MDLIPFSLSGSSLESYIIKISSRSKVIYWIIIITAISGLVILPFIYVDVSIQARGFFQTDIERQVVVVPFQGKVIYSSVHNGVRVKKGDTLLIINSEALKAQQAALISKIEENDASISDIEELVKADYSSYSPIQLDITTQRYKAEFENLKNQLGIQLQQYRKNLTEHDRNKLLFEQDIIPAIDFENSQFMLRSEKENLDHILVHQISLWQNDITFRRVEATKLKADLRQLDEGLYNRTVLAPVSGEIIESTDIQTGSVVTAGQKIAEISPDGKLLATCFVRPSDIGLIHTRQKVRIMVDALNYNEWGILEGEITEISDDMIVENGSMAFFRVRCEPEREFLTLKNGHKSFLKKGMSLNARIVVTRRTLFNLLFDKTDKWLNPYMKLEE